MNLPRLALAAVMAWLAFLVLDAAVRGMLLAELYRAEAAVLRPAEEANLAVGGVGALVGFFAFAYAYVKGYEGGSGLWEGLRYGVLVALMLASFGLGWAYVTFPISARLAFARLIETIVEFSLYGVIVGVLYKPLPLRA
jgi:hypothetical protein